MARQTVGQKGFLARLLRNQAGNTLAITAAAIFPLMGLIGGGVDISRLYLVKTRLQQACDAGALAGRKAQSGGSWTTATQTTANNIFDTNYASGAYGTTGLSRAFTEHDGKVTGTAGVTVPMMIMSMFGFTQKVLNVTCDAEMRLPHSDIMFVLDVTGSMNCAPDDSYCSNNGNVPATGSKIDGLKTAVQCFYEILQKIDTPANCGSTPSGGISDQIQIRYGFVPYNVNVNVGRLLPNDYFADRWKYQSREATTQTAYAWTATGSESSITGWGNWSSAPSNIYTASSYSNWSNINGSGVYINGSYYSKTVSASNQSQCDANNTVTGNVVGYVDSPSAQSPSGNINAPVYPASQYTTNYTQSDYHTVTAYQYGYTTSPKRCTLNAATRTYTLTRSGGSSTTPISWTTYQKILNWTYKQVTTSGGFDVSPLKAGGSSWNSSVSLPIGENSVSVKLSGSTSTTTIKALVDTNVNWDGCVEERKTAKVDSYSPIPTDAYDLDIDMVPSAANSDTKWGPLLQYAVWGRYTGSSSNTLSDVVTSSTLNRNNSYYCPTAARRLTRYMTTTAKDDFVSYVNSINAIGNTYHDIGLLWGARLMSPTGIFGADNAFTPQGGEIQRHLIFMTDGDTQTGNENYTPYGIPWWDRRTTSSTSAPSSSSLDTDVNARFAALCTAIKNKNITLWVVNYGGGVSTTTGARLQTCASPNRYYEATSVSSLLTTFQQIAAQISQLRLTN